MNDAVQLILKKLDGIEKRLGVVENKGPHSNKVSEKRTVEKNRRDPLFDKALRIILKKDGDIPSSYLQEKLNVDAKRVEKIFDQLEKAGYGSSYMGEA